MSLPIAALILLAALGAIAGTIAYLLRKHRDKRDMFRDN